jgi:DNA polymerase III epsilon subunit-like protein
MRSLMIDLETLGTTADAVILSIGAVAFDLNASKVSDEGFYVSVSIDSNLELGRRISEDTLIWWFKQSAAAQQVFHEPKEHLREALRQLSDWIGANDYEVWSNGADFDIPMLAHAFTQCGLQVPWKFWNARCYRTYKNLPGAKNLALPPKEGTAHNALADAYNQAQAVCTIHQALFAKIKVKA